MSNLLLEKHKLAYHPDVMSKFQRGDKFAPINMEISPSSACNQSCENCYTKHFIADKKSPRMMSKELLFKVIKDCADFGVKSISFCGTGEPLMNPYVPEAISYIKKLGLDSSLVTNGLLASRKQMENCFGDLAYFRVSTTAGESKRYAKLQGSTEQAFYTLMKNLEELVELKHEKKLETTIGVAYFVLDGCEKDMRSFVMKLRDSGVDYIQIKPLGDFEKANYKYDKEYYKSIMEELQKCELLTNENFTCLVRYNRFEDFEKMTKGLTGLPTKCWALYFNASVGTDGKVYPCGGSWYEEKDCYGSLQDNTLEEIWQSERWKQVFERRSKINTHECFFACRNTEMNKYLIDFMSPPAHINFI